MLYILALKTTQNKHILYINDEPLDAEAAAKEISKMLKSLVIENTPQKPIVSATPQSTVNDPVPRNTPQAALKLNPSEQKNTPILTQFQDFESSSVSISDLKSITSLIEAIKNNNQEEFFRLLKLKTDRFGKRFIDEVDSEYNGSPLYWAAAFGHIHFIDPLLQAGADINKQDKQGRTLVYKAALNGHASAITALHTAGANVDTPNRNGATPVYIAAEKEHESAITALHAAGANVNMPQKDGATPAYVAAYNGHASAITALYIAGANVNTSKDGGFTPVYIAAYNGHVSAIAALHAAGANVNTPISDGKTPVFIAAYNGHASAITALYAAGANVDTPCDGATPVFIAAQNGHVSAIAALHAAGANMNTPMPDGITSVYIAVCNGHTLAITALLEAGANASIKTKWGTALSFARQGKDPEHREAVKILEAHFKQYPNGIKPVRVMNPVVSFSAKPSSVLEQKDPPPVPKKPASQLSQAFRKAFGKG